MPETGMDWWVVAGVLVAIVGVFVAWRKSARKGANVIRHGSSNRQSGGDNRVEHGDNNDQRN